MIKSSKAIKILKRLSRLNASILFILEARQDFNENDEPLIHCFKEKEKAKQLLEETIKKFKP